MNLQENIQRIKQMMTYIGIGNTPKMYMMKRKKFIKDTKIPDSQ